MQAPPTKRVFPDHLVVDSDGKLACELAEDYGYPSDPWQQALVSDLLSFGDNGRFAVQNFGFSAPRRSGKTHVIIILTLYFLLITESQVVYTAHRSDSAAEVWNRVLDLFEDTELAEYVATNGISRRPGHETLTLTSGASFRLFSRSSGKGSGRGSEADVLFLDEAMDLPQASLGDLQPMLSVSSNPLTVYLGTPSLDHHADGTAFRSFRDNVLNGTNPKAGWWEYAAPENADPFDKANWYLTNPALVTGRITEDYISGEVYSGMSARQILVERLGSWETMSRTTIVDMEALHRLGAKENIIAEDSPLVIGLDTDPDEKVTSVVAVGRDTEGVPVVELIEHGPGSTWVPVVTKAIFEAQPNVKAFLIDKQSHLAQYAEALRKEGIPVVLTQTEYMSLACPAFIQAVNSESFKHRADPRFTQSVFGADKRSLMGRYAWKRVGSDADITALVAATIALYGLDSEAAVPSKKHRPRTNTVTIGGKTYTR